MIPLACAECDDSLSFSGASSIPLCYTPFPSTLFHQLVFHPPLLHLAIYFLVYLSASLFPSSYIVLFWGFYFLPFYVHSIEQKSIGLKLSKSRTGSHVTYSCQHNLSPFLSPYLGIRGVSLSSIHYNQSHRIYINRKQKYICIISN